MDAGHLWRLQQEAHHDPRRPFREHPTMTDHLRNEGMSPPAKAQLGRVQARTLRAVVAAIRPRGHGFDQPIDDDVARQVEQSIAHLPGALGLWFKMGLRFIEYGPPIYARRLSRFSNLPPPEGLEYLSRWEQARGPVKTLLRGLRFLIMFSFYQHPDVLADLEVDWAGRAVTLTRLRAELLEERAAGDSDGR